MVTKPEKPSPDFPLFSHSNGQWAKKIKGKIHYFGKWGSPDEALERYLKEKDFLMAGRTPPSHNGHTVLEVFDRFLEHRRSDVETGELGERTWNDYKKNCALVCSMAGDWIIEKMGPEEFGNIRSHLSEGVGTTTLRNRVRMARVAFHFFEEITRERLHWGKSFREPSKKQQRKAKAEAGEKLMSREQILKALKDAKNVQLKAMILLGINSGFGNQDCSDLEWSHLDLENGWYDAYRTKTYVKRRAKLWPTTVEHLKKIPQKHKDLVFITKYGNPWLSSSIGSEASKLGFSFYNLRRTFRTVAEATQETMAIRLNMGHAANSGDMDAIYVQAIADDKLSFVSEYVHAWLFKDASENTSSSA